MKITSEILSMKKINFLKTKKTNYENVRNNINSPILKYLNKNETIESKRYKNNAINFTLFIRDHADVIMSHGVADKNYFSMRVDNERLVNGFSHVLVPGPWLKRKILKLPGVTVPKENIHIVGWPRLDYLIELKNSLSLPISKVKPRVLWAPTHDFKKRGSEKESTSSYPEFDKYSEEMRALFNYNLALHPRNRESKEPTAELLVQSDFVISDFGTMVYEAWALGIPVIFPRWILKDRIIKYTKNSAEAYIFKNNIGLHANSFEELVNMINERAPLGIDVCEFMEDYLPSELLGNSGEIIGSVLKSIKLKRHSYIVRFINKIKYYKKTFKRQFNKF